VEDRLLLEQALLQLKPLECAIVERHYLEEQPFSAIGKELGIPTERAKKICQRAIQKMQKWAQSGGVGITHTRLCPEEGIGGVLMNGSG
jgi:DNA-directed RNA polymerase specialized sigma24 family protein